MNIKYKLLLFLLLLLLLVFTSISGLYASDMNLTSTGVSSGDISVGNDNVNHMINSGKNISSVKEVVSSPDKVYVSTGGDDANDGGVNSPKATLRSALDSVREGGSVYLRSGTYYESGICIDKDVHIIGDKTQTTIIDSQKRHTFTIKANVFLTAFTISNAKDKNNGGAIYNKGTLTLDGVKIKLSSSAGYGGAVYNKGKLTAKKSSFSSNNAVLGGAIYSVNKLTLNRCTFSNNKAYNMSSGIYSTDYMYLYSCNFTDNKNTAVFVGSSDRLQYIKSSLFSSNRAGNGGAVYNLNNNLSVIKTYFGNNSVSGLGGAVYNSGRVSLVNSTLSGNTASYGGGVYNRGSLLMDNASVKNNKAITSGGAVYTTGYTRITGSKFYSNIAQKGGALLSKSEGGVVLLCVNNSVFSRNVAGTGGALFVYNHTRLVSENSCYEYNYNNSIYINTDSTGNLLKACNFTKNNAGYGGAIRCAYTNLSITGCVLCDNSAISGGAIHNYNGWVVLNYNMLTGNGGDIYSLGFMDVNRNWWGSNNVDKTRIINCKAREWLYITLTHQYDKSFNSTVNTTVSVYNMYSDGKITRIPGGTSLPVVPLKILVNGCGVNKTVNAYNIVSFTNRFTCEGSVSFTIMAPGYVSKQYLLIHKPYKAYLYMQSISTQNTSTTIIPLNVTDELNNTIRTGKVDVYINNNKVLSQNIGNKIVLGRQKVGVYDLKVVFTDKEYITTTKTVKLTVNPPSNIKLRLVDNPAYFTGRRGTLRAVVNNKNNHTTNTGIVKFYFNNKYVGSSNTKNNISTFKIIMPEKAGAYPVKAEYYLQDKFIIAAADYKVVNKQEAQVAQNTYITLAGDLVKNSRITSSKKDVYFAMDRTTADYDNSPNDMKIMNNIAYNLRSNGFNVKTVRNGPGETYETANYMYKHNIRNSICFILCNGVDANVIREYLYGYDSLLTSVRKRGNDIVLGWFHGAGDIYNPDGEYYYWLEKAWDDNYSSWGGISNPRKTMEKDGIRVLYEKYDMNGDRVSASFTRLYGGIVTENVSRNSSISLKTHIYDLNNNKVNGRIVYTLNGKVIQNVSVTGNDYTFKYTMPSVTGTYNLTASYYSGSRLVCSTSRYLKVK